MRLKKLSVLALLATTLFFSQGCATTGANTQQTVQKASMVLRTISEGAAVLAIADNAGNKKHVELAVTILDQFILGGNYKPGELVAAFEPIFKELKKPEVRFAVNSALTLYQGLYGDYVSGKLAGNENAKVLLTALRDGAKAGLVGQ